MSLDMTVGAREAALDCTENGIEAEISPVERPWLRSLMAAAATTFGVTISAALGVLLFLR